MSDTIAGDVEPSRSGPAHFFPLVRHLSTRFTPVLARLPLTANQITLASLLFGLGAGWCMALAAWPAAIVGGVLLVVCYVLDNCDGEIARLKDQSSEFGRRFDNFVDWAVHTAFFAALGWGGATAAGQSVWFWLGAIAAVGSTINYVIGTLAEERHAARRSQTENPPDHDAAADSIATRPEHWWQWITFAFRELSRADFCFIVLALAAFDLTWILLPLGAVGAQAFWIAHLLPDARKYHV
jgi:phosphatidylglycerophosphate synthase